MKIEYAKVITVLSPGVSFLIENDDIDNIIWQDGNTNNITKAQILAKQIELQNIEDVKPENVKKASAVAKLKALGLTDEEIGALKI